MIVPVFWKETGIKWIAGASPESEFKRPLLAKPFQMPDRCLGLFAAESKKLPPDHICDIAASNITEHHSLV
jgi:hypothetical protein